MNKASNLKTRPQLKDWNGIRYAWLNGASLGEISVRFNVAKSTVCERAKREKWDELKEYTAQETERKIVQKVSEEHAEREVEIADLVSEGVRGVVGKVVQGLHTASSKDYQKLRAYMSILKDAKEMGIYKTDRDIAEQLARIKKLEKDASTLEQDNTINVVISSEVEEYAN